MSLVCDGVNASISVLMSSPPLLSSDDVSLTEAGSLSASGEKIKRRVKTPYTLKKWRPASWVVSTDTAFDQDFECSNGGFNNSQAHFAYGPHKAGSAGIPKINQSKSSIAVFLVGGGATATTTSEPDGMTCFWSRLTQTFLFLNKSRFIFHSFVFPLFCCGKWKFVTVQPPRRWTEPEAKPQEQEMRHSCVHRRWRQTDWTLCEMSKRRWSFRFMLHLHFLDSAGRFLKEPRDRVASDFHLWPCLCSTNLDDVQNIFVLVLKCDDSFDSRSMALLWLALCPAARGCGQIFKHL